MEMRRPPDARRVRNERSDLLGRRRDQFNPVRRFANISLCSFSSASLLPLLRFPLYAAASVFLAGCASHVAPTRAHAVAPAYALTQKAGPEDLYPNPEFTPGVTNPEVTQANIHQTICLSGWTTSVRPKTPYTNNLKTEGIKQYGYNDPKLEDYEEDHFVPLEVGGNPTNPKNLWPEPYDTKVSGKTMGARQKDKVEDLLEKQVCDGTISLKEAQKQITSDWYKIYLAHF